MMRDDISYGRTNVICRELRVSRLCRICPTFPDLSEHLHESTQMTSANSRSVARKYHNPPNVSKAITLQDTRRPGTYKVCSPPRMDQRNPSITPAIGLRK